MAYAYLIYNLLTGEVVDKAVINPRAKLTGNDYVKLYTVGNGKNPEDYGFIEVTVEQFIESNNNKGFNEVVNGKLIMYPKIQITADKSQITTTETCIITATITPPEGENLVDEEVIFTIDGVDYPVTTTNGQAQIEYSNENPGLHEIQVRSTTKYGQNSIIVEVVE